MRLRVRSAEGTDLWVKHALPGVNGTSFPTSKSVFLHDTTRTESAHADGPV